METTTKKKGFFGGMLQKVKPKHETHDLTVPGEFTDGLLRLAVQSNAGIEQIDRLMKMKYRHEEREARKDFFQALSVFQASVGVMTKNGDVDYPNKDGGRTSYKYAPLGQIEMQIKEPMARTGLAKRFTIKQTPALITVGCVITHVAGHSETTFMEAPPDVSGKKNVIKSFGSTVTYLQRYTLIGALGLVTADEDNDGTTPPAPPKPPPMAQPKTQKVYAPKPADVLPPEKPLADIPKDVPSTELNTLKKLFKKLNPDRPKEELKSLWLDFTGGEVALSSGTIRELGIQLTAELNKRNKGAGK